MNQKTLITLGIAAALAVGIALFVDHSRAPQNDVSARAGLLVPDLRDHVNEVTRISMTAANNQPAVTLARGEHGWTVAQRGGYPADVGKLRDFLLKVADATLLEEKTSNKERYADLGVDDITGASAKGVLLDLEGLPKQARIVVGTFNAQGGGTFVRRAEEAQSWLAKGSLAPEKNPADWLAKDLANIAAERIASVTLTRPDGKLVRVAKKVAADTRFDIVDVPKGREPSSEYVANGLGAVLSELRIDDVAPVAEAAPPPTALKARYVAFDGLVVDAVAWKVGEKAYATFVATLDEASANKHIGEAQAKAVAEHATAAANAAKPDAGSTTAPAAEAATPAPLAVTDAAKDREQRLVAAREEVAKLNAAFNGWSFVVPAHKFSNIDKSMDDLLKPLEAKASAKPQR